MNDTASVLEGEFCPDEIPTQSQIELNSIHCKIEDFKHKFRTKKNVKISVSLLKSKADCIIYIIAKINAYHRAIADEKKLQSDISIEVDEVKEELVIIKEEFCNDLRVMLRTLPTQVFLLNHPLPTIPENKDRPDFDDENKLHSECEQAINEIELIIGEIRTAEDLGKERELIGSLKSKLTELFAQYHIMDKAEKAKSVIQPPEDSRLGLDGEDNGKRMPSCCGIEFLASLDCTAWRDSLDRLSQACNTAYKTITGLCCGQ